MIRTEGFVEGDHMRKRRFGLLLLVLIVLGMVTACSKKEEDNPLDRLASYTKLWEKEQWQEMYDQYLTEDAKKVFGKEQMIERTKKVFEDLAIENVQTSYDALSEEAMKELDKEKPIHVPVEVVADTVAGPLTFTVDVPLVYDDAEEREDWYIEWDPSFILPQLSKDDQVKIETIQAKRGEIIDRNDKELAINGSGAKIGVTAGQFDVSRDGEKLASTIGTTKDFIASQLKQDWVQEGHFVPIKSIPFTQEDQYDAALKIEGVTASKEEMREYPYADALAHLIGYIGKINAEELEELKSEGYHESSLIGKRGLEQLLEKELRGEEGVAITIVKPDQDEEITIVEKEAKDGETVKLTIDAEFQKVILEEMKGEAGMAAAIDPKTGETLALVSSPSFDPNEFTLGISSSRYETLANDEKQPLLNRFANTYAPASSIKPITALIGLKAGTLDANKTYQFEGKTWQKDPSWGSYGISRVYETPNPVDLKKGLVYSDNIYFANEALNLGKEKFVAGLKEFGFDGKFEYAYPIRASQISNDGSITSEGQLINSSYGQGEMLMNIVHLAATYSPILQDGTMMKPILFADEKKGEVWKEDLVSADHAKLMQTYLRAVITDGFAEDANIKSLKISGKTGTAELKASKEESGQENGFFVAYPTEKKDYILAMMIEGIEDKGGSNYVADKAAKAMKKK